MQHRQWGPFLSRHGNLTTKSETHSQQLCKGQQTLAVSCFLFYFFPMLRYWGCKQHIKDESSSSLLPRLGGKVLHLQPHNNLYGCVDIFSLQNFCTFEITLGKSKVLDQKCLKKIQQMGQSGKELMTINMNVNLFQFILSMSIPCTCCKQCR